MMTRDVHLTTAISISSTFVLSILMINTRYYNKLHRDVKGSNILVTDAGVAKLADFGCSKQLPGLCTASLEESLLAIRGSVPWMAPEVIKQSGHGRSSDIWSFGATVIEMGTYSCTHVRK
jgi:serine/threonine protein kinase